MDNTNHRNHWSCQSLLHGVPLLTIDSKMHTPTHFLQAIKAAVNGITAIMNNPDFIYYLFFRHEEDQMCRQIEVCKVYLLISSQHH